MESSGALSPRAQPKRGTAPPACFLTCLAAFFSLGVSKACFLFSLFDFWALGMVFTPVQSERPEPLGAARPEPGRRPGWRVTGGRSVLIRRPAIQLARALEVPGGSRIVDLDLAHDLSYWEGVAWPGRPPAPRAPPAYRPIPDKCIQVFAASGYGGLAGRARRRDGCPGRSGTGPPRWPPSAPDHG